MRAVITYALFPVWFALAFAVAGLALRRGWSTSATLAGITAATVAIIAIAERVHPAHAEWNRARGDVRTDLIHGLVSMITLPAVLEIALTAALLSVATRLSGAVGFALWPTHWPLWLQLPLALLISQFGEYWLHRLMHERPLLWRLHATHHSPERLYWLNAARFHPLDTALTYTNSLSVLLVLGAGPEVLFLQAVWMAVHGLFQHCNVHLRLGPLNYVFSMAELHRWHHSPRLEEANANYGNNIIFWDLVFGTFFHPRDRDADPAVGLHDPAVFPRGYLGQIASPFAWARLTRPR
ncbi:MAG: sterol desaturase family protein [Myxococcales bacterium]|nr:sterol desaturase family protein [Myxococcales bacterium]